MILSKEEFFTQLQERIGTDTSDESIEFMENMTDTYNDLENRAANAGEDWETKYKALDESWKARYRHRFFSGNGGNPNNPEQSEPENGYDPESIEINDLFKEDK